MVCAVCLSIFLGLTPPMWCCVIFYHNISIFCDILAARFLVLLIHSKQNTYKSAFTMYMLPCNLTCGFWSQWRRQYQQCNWIDPNVRYKSNFAKISLYHLLNVPSRSGLHLFYPKKAICLHQIPLTIGLTTRHEARGTINKSRHIKTAIYKPRNPDKLWKLLHMRSIDSY